MTKDGSKIRKQADMDGNLMVTSNTGVIADDPFSVDILNEHTGGENGKELYDTEGNIIAHPTLVTKKIAEYYTSSNRECFYPPFVRQVMLTERFLGQRLLQSWMPSSDGTAPVLDDNLRQAETMVYAINEALSLEHSGMAQADLLKHMLV